MRWLTNWRWWVGSCALGGVFAVGIVLLFMRQPPGYVETPPAAYQGCAGDFRSGIAVEHIHYDANSNSLHIASWTDSSSGLTYPAPGTTARGLTPLTVHVHDAPHVHVRIDGKEHTCLVRDGSNHGGGSVTIVDDSDPVTIFDEIDLYQRNGIEDCTNAESHYRSSGAFRGTYCLEVRLTKSQGEVRWTLPPRDVADCRYLRFAYRKSRPAAKISVSVQAPDGTSWTISEADGRAEADSRYVAPEDADWHEAVVDITPFVRKSGGRVSAVILHGDGETGDQLYFDALQFLRCPVTPPSPDDWISLEGQVSADSDGLPVTLVTQRCKVSATTRAGHFAFPRAVRRGETAMVYCVPPDGARRYSDQGRLLEVDPHMPSLTISLADLRDVNRGVTLTRSNRFSQIFDQDVGMLYQPKTYFDHGGGGTPQEFQTRLQVNNLGYLDRDRRSDNVDRVPRILMLGACDLFGHSVPRNQHANIAMEGLLHLKTGRRHEVIALADANTNFGRCWRFYEKIGRPFGARIVVMTVCCGSVLVESDPDLVCRCYEYDPDHLPFYMFRSRPDGTLEELAADAEYPMFTGKNARLKAIRTAELKEGGHRYYMEGIDWVAALHRVDGELPPRVRKALDHFERILLHYRDGVNSDGAELIIAIQPLLGMQQYTNQTEWRDAQGVRYQSSKFGERLKALLDRHGIRYVDIHEYAGRHARDPQMFFWRHDQHPSAHGFEWIAEALLDYIDRNGLMSGAVTAAQ